MGVIAFGCAHPQFKAHHGCRIDPGLTYIAAAVSEEGDAGAMDIAPMFKECL